MSTRDNVQSTVLAVRRVDGDPRGDAGSGVNFEVKVVLVQCLTACAGGLPIPHALSGDRGFAEKGLERMPESGWETVTVPGAVDAWVIWDPFLAADGLVPPEWLARLRELLPGAFAEGKLIPEKLSELVGAAGVSAAPERYGLSYTGRSEALRETLAMLEHNANRNFDVGIAVTVADLIARLTPDHERASLEAIDTFKTRQTTARFTISCKGLLHGNFPDQYGITACNVCGK